MFSRGSEWRKWDLHVHTKGTNKNDNFSSIDMPSFCEIFFKKALENNIQAIGITDYFSIDNYKKIKAYVDEIDSVAAFSSDEKEKIRKIFILPNVELRILPATASGGLINIHCIFNPDDNFIASLENDFFSSLEDSGGHKMNRAGLISLGKASNPDSDDRNAYKKGVEEFHLEPSTLIKLFKEKLKLKENTIIVVSNSNCDGASSLRKHYQLFEHETGSLDGVRRNIYTLADAIFSGNPTDRDFFLGDKNGCDAATIIKQCGSLKPCIHGSDAHCEDKLFNPDMNRFCWIKADLSFEGLKQIICEPKDRVKIQSNKPEEKSGYHVIKSVSIDSDICKQTISLNPNLNTIIGGRSTGKSTLLEIIAHKINKTTMSTKPFIADIPDNKIKIIWQDGEENDERDIDFFKQSHMYEVARDKQKKDLLIKGIIDDKDQKNIIKNFYSFCISNKIKIQNDLDALFELQKNVTELKLELKEQGDENGLRKEIISLTEKIDEAHKQGSATPEELEKYKLLKHEIAKIQQSLTKIETDEAQIHQLMNEDFFDSSFDYKLIHISELNSKKVHDIYSKVKTLAIETWKNELKNNLVDINNSIKTYRCTISNYEKADAFIKGTRQLETNKQYKELIERLTIENSKLSKIKSIQDKIEIIEKQKVVLKEQLINSHIDFVNKTNNLIDEFSLAHDDIIIKTEKHYQDGKCTETLRDFINLQSYDRQRFVNDWGLNYKNDIRTTIESFLEKALENQIELKAYKNIKDLAKCILTENWYSISYDLTYQNDTFDKMSDGKKAFVILKLLLDFSKKECPILIDQPEDSLDNRAIYNELVAYLKKKKKERQIILVTHNANIVVNADAEQIIVANQHGENSKNHENIKFQYITGSLENSKRKIKNTDIILNTQGIKEHVCEILEGGREAFKKRENKYSLS